MGIDYLELRRKWTRNPAGLKLLARRDRHARRIARLERVLDPKDTHAKGDERRLDEYRAELERRTEQLRAVEAEIRALMRQDKAK